MERFVVALVVVGIKLKMNSSAVKIVNFRRNYSLAAVMLVLHALRNLMHSSNLNLSALSL